MAKTTTSTLHKIKTKILYHYILNAAMHFGNSQTLNKTEILSIMKLFVRISLLVGTAFGGIQLY